MSLSSAASTGPDGLNVMDCLFAEHPHVFVQGPQSSRATPLSHCERVKDHFRCASCNSTQALSILYYRIMRTLAINLSYPSERSALIWLLCQIPVALVRQRAHVLAHALLAGFFLRFSADNFPSWDAAFFMR